MDKFIAMEEWRDIPGYEGRLQASNLGRIKRLARTVSNHTGVVHLPDRIIKGHVITNGYIQVEVSSRPNRKTKLVHVLVALAFIPNPTNRPQINHKNGNKQDNRMENLEWCNNSENQKHAYKCGLQHRSDMAGKPPKPVMLSRNGNVFVFESLASAARFLGGQRYHRTNLRKVLNPKYPNYKTINGYTAEYVV